MKKWVLCLVLGGVLIGGVAMAQYVPPPPPVPPWPDTVCPHEDPDEICIVFDHPADCCMNCTQFFGGQYSAYVVIQNLSSPSGLSGYEFCLCNWDGTPFMAPPSCFITGYTYPPGAINAATEPCFAVGLATPLPNAGWCTKILTINLLVFCQDCWCFGVEPNIPASIPDHMAYADGINPGLLKILNPCTGPDQDSCYMTCLNCPWCPPDPPIASEPSTWGALKGLYR
jgi:hypothetical protein